MAPIDLRNRYFPEEDEPPPSEILDRMRLGAPQIGDVEAQFLPTARSTMMSPEEFSRAAPTAADPRAAARGGFGEAMAPVASAFQSPKFGPPLAPLPGEGGTRNIVSQLMAGGGGGSAPPIEGPRLDPGAPSMEDPRRFGPPQAPLPGEGRAQTPPIASSAPPISGAPTSLNPMAGPKVTPGFGPPLAPGVPATSPAGVPATSPAGMSDRDIMAALAELLGGGERGVRIGVIGEGEREPFDLNLPDGGGGIYA